MIKLLFIHPATVAALGLVCAVLSAAPSSAAVTFTREFAPQDGLTAPVEKPYRSEICLNGSWQFQPVEVPGSFHQNVGPAPQLPPPAANGWDPTPIKIPSPWNVNAFPDRKGLGGDFRCYPSYPAAWNAVQMGWLHRKFRVPEDWRGRRVLLHFGAIAGDAQALVNGKPVGEHFDIFLPFDIDITDSVTFGADNDLLVGVRKASLFDVQGKYGRRTYQAGSMWGQAIAGIWQDVFLEAVPAVHISDVFVKPQVDQDTLQADVTVQNDTDQAASVSVANSVYPWISHAGPDPVSAPEPNWSLGERASLESDASTATVPAHGSVVVALQRKVGGALSFWSPDNPNLYGMVCSLKAGNGTVIDDKYTRFGWRQITLQGSAVLLNGKPLIMKGDSWHFIGIPEMTRRYAWAWFHALKDAHLNAVRLHAEPYPSLFLDVADEQGILVLDEDAVWASDGGPKIDDQQFWDSSEIHLQNLILRDRNHPSVFGWSISNELMAVVRGVFHAPREFQDRVLRQDAVWADICRKNDPTRSWISADGEDDGGGALPVYVIHYGGVEAMKRAAASGKPWGVGEAGPAYYGSPRQIEQQSGDQRAYVSFLDRMEGVASVSYGNLIDQRTNGASYRSVFNMVWYGLKPLNLGMADTTRAPDLTDGIFFPKYVEGKPGVQPERIGPYSTTLNPGYDPSLPLYQPWPLFDAIRDAQAEPPVAYQPEQPFQVDASQPRGSTAASIKRVRVLSGSGGSLAKSLADLGAPVAAGDDSADPGLVFVDGIQPPNASAKATIEQTLNAGGTVFVWGASDSSLQALNELLPDALALTDRTATSLTAASPDPLTAGLTPASMYFSELNPSTILPAGLAGPLIDKAAPLLIACNADWNRWNRQPEMTKTAMLLRSEREAKPSGVALAELQVGGGRLVVCNIPAAPLTSQAARLDRALLANLGVALGDGAAQRNSLDSAGVVTRVLACGQFGAATPAEALATNPVAANTAADIIAGSVIQDRPWGAVKADSTGALDLSSLRRAGKSSDPFFYASVWLYSPKALDNLLLDPHLPNLNLIVGSATAAQVWLNARSVAVQAQGSDLAAQTLLLQQGWNHLLVKVVQDASIGTGPKLTIQSSQPDYLAEMRAAEERP